jgi:hypothetical protein
MAATLATIYHVQPLTIIRRQRLLPVPGKLLVRKGQKVGATDTVAEAVLAPEHLILNLAGMLGVSAGQADNLVQVKAGEILSEGDLIAGPVGMGRRVVRAPQKARVISLGEGRMLLELLSAPFELKAGLPGMVLELLPERGVTIETQGALIQGAWGNGKIEYGALFNVVAASDEALHADLLNVSLRGAIVLAGYLDDPQILRAAIELPMRGLILGSMHAGLLPMAQEIPMPILLTEGFAHARGQRPMNSAAFKLLTTSDRSEITLNAERHDPYAGTRPEIVIPRPASAETPAQARRSFEAGQQVRVVRAPAASLVGVIAELRGVQTLPSGVRLPCAEVHLENDSIQVLPLANLEVLG